MLPRPATSNMTGSTMALLAGASSNNNNSTSGFKRPRVNSKAGAALGSLFRSKMHTKRNSNGSDTVVPSSLEPLPEPSLASASSSTYTNSANGSTSDMPGTSSVTATASWDVSIDYPAAVSPLFSDESLQQLLAASPHEEDATTSSFPATAPSSAAADAPPQFSTSFSSSALNNSARRSKREIAASVLHTSAGPFRRLRHGPASKTLSYPPAIGSENGLYDALAINHSGKAGGDEFVLVTSDMCPPASLVNTSVFSGVRSADLPARKSTSSEYKSSSSSRSRGGSAGRHQQQLQQQMQQRQYQQNLRSGLALRGRAQTQVNGSSDHLFLRPGIGDAASSFVDSTDSLVPISAPSLSTSSSEVSLPSQHSGRLSHLRNGSGRRHVPAPIPQSTINGKYGVENSNGKPKSPRKASECSFSSTEERQRHMSQMARLECLSPYTVSRLNNTAAKASERRRRSSVHSPLARGRASSDIPSPTPPEWGFSGASDVTLLPGHARNVSEQGPGDGYNFAFQIQSAAQSPTFWSPGGEEEEEGSLLPSDDETAPSTNSTTTSTKMATGTINSRRGRRVRRDIQSLLDPNSLMIDAGSAMPLHVLAQQGDGKQQDPPDTPSSADHIDFDGSTLTQNSDWQIMDASSSDNEQSPTQIPHPRRRVRKRRVLPKTLFKMGKGPTTLPSSNSVDTLLTVESAAAKTKSAAIPHVPEAVPEVPEIIPMITGDEAQALHMRVPRLADSLVMYMSMECTGSIRLSCSGDGSGWDGARIDHFSLRLSMFIRRAYGLAELRLINLGLSAVPRTVVSCRGLKRLDLSHNWIETAPAFLTQLPRLQHIVLRGNPIRMVAADLIDMREQLSTLDLGGNESQHWTLISRPPCTPEDPLLPKSMHGRKELLARRIQTVAQRRISRCVDAPRLALTQRTHDKTLDRAQRLLSLYANALYSALREPKSWGHAVAIPYPSSAQGHFSIP